MSGWLTKAADALRGEQPEQPDPFEVECACGVRHSGLRRRRPQRIICRECGTALFILPRDSYPAPLAPEPRPKKRGKKKKRKQGVAAVPPDAPPRFQQVATNVFQVSEKVGRKAASAGVGFGTRVRTWFFAFLAIWTPLRLILLGCIAICTATVAYTLLADRSAQAVLDLKEANEAAREALANDQINTAYDQFALAVAALDTLDRHDDPLAREIRQLHRETTAIHGAMPISPLQIVTEADAAREAEEDQDWQQKFRTHYRDRWLIVDGTLMSNASRDDGKQFSVVLPLRVGPQGRGIELQMTVPGLDELAAGNEPLAAIVAVEVVGCELSKDKRTWTLETDSQSAFLWGTIDNYEAAGFQLETSEERGRVEQVLAAQQSVLGLAGPEEVAVAPEPTPVADAGDEGGTE